MFEKRTRPSTALRDAIDRHGVPIREVAGRRPPAGRRRLHAGSAPPAAGAAIVGSDNANSLVLAVEYLGRRILLPGDLESPGLDDVLAEEPMRCDVLLAPHHGSRKSNSPALAAWCRPRWVVFSGDGRWNVPESESPYQAVGGQVLHTYRQRGRSTCGSPPGSDVSGFVEP